MKHNHTNTMMTTALVAALALSGCVGPDADGWNPARATAFAGLAHVSPAPAAEWLYVTGVAVHHPDADIDGIADEWTYGLHLDDDSWEIRVDQDGQQSSLEPRASVSGLEPLSLDALLDSDEVAALANDHIRESGLDPEEGLVRYWLGDAGDGPWWFFQFGGHTGRSVSFILDAETGEILPQTDLPTLAYLDAVQAAEQVLGDLDIVQAFASEDFSGGLREVYLGGGNRPTLTTLPDTDARDGLASAWALRIVSDGAIRDVLVDALGGIRVLEASTTSSHDSAPDSVVDPTAFASGLPDSSEGHLGLPVSYRLQPDDGWVWNVEFRSGDALSGWIVDATDGSLRQCVPEYAC